MKHKDVDGWWPFLKLCTKMKSPDEFKHFFDLFLTIEEKEVIGKRFLIIQALKENKLTQREIAKKYGVSISQITRGSNAMKIIDKALKRALEDLI